MHLRYVEMDAEMYAAMHDLPTAHHVEDSTQEPIDIRGLNAPKGTRL
ncbi:MAG: hypothetical protein KatS3mg050_4216 [Litorilinea sp.]|nr:MAG: hypothetical protein KatS3mg050_4216 [Litorilinea sp.]